MNRLFFFLALVNLIAFIYGLYYYLNQLKEWNPIFWIFIIDCPLQALFAGIIFLNLSKESNKNYNEINMKEKIESSVKYEFEQFINFVSIGTIKYGLWTIAVILIYSNYFLMGESFLEYLILLIAHFGLFLEGVYFAGEREINNRWMLISLGFYLVNDLLDYTIGTRPSIPNENIELISIMTVGLTLLSFFIVNYLGKRRIKIIRLRKLLNER